VLFHLRFWRTYKIATLNKRVSNIKFCFRLGKMLGKVSNVECRFRKAGNGRTEVSE